MIQITRSTARQIGAVFRRCAGKSTRLHAPVVTFLADDNGLRLRLTQEEIAAEYHVQGSFDKETFTLPLAAFAAFEGRADSLVTLEATDGNEVQASWEDAGVPQVKEYVAGDLDRQPAFPELPAEFVTNAPELLAAMQAAVAVADSDGVRYALQRIQLRGQKGEIVSTNGAQLLLLGGFHFPWKEELLVTRTTTFASRELGAGTAMEVGRSETHVAFRIGQWSIHLKIDTEAKYPQVDSIVPQPKANDTLWQIDPEDATFLSRALPRLPGDDVEYQPLTVDLNGQVSLRGRGQGHSRITELVLARSKYTGQPVRLALNRQHLARALQLGLREVHLKPDTPVLYRDERRSYVCVPLDKRMALPPADDALCISSVDTGANQKSSSPERKCKAMSTPKNNASSQVADEADADKKPAGDGNSVIGEAQALKDALREAFGRSSRLLAALQRQKKHSKLVASTLASLRELQQIGA